VRVDVANEDEGLAAALERLATDAGLRQRLGAQAAAWVRREHAPERVVAAWERALERARARPDPAPRAWPAHWPRPEPREGRG
jgi:glycosyltransferase involved in cell wall biosynthesis